MSEITTEYLTSLRERAAFVLHLMAPTEQRLTAERWFYKLSFLASEMNGVGYEPDPDAYRAAVVLIARSVLSRNFEAFEKLEALALAARERSVTAANTLLVQASGGVEDLD